MDYEKRFNQVLAKAQEAITYLPDPALKKWLESVFPELKDSKNEKIRKWIVRTLKSLNNSSVQIDGAYEMMLPAIAWLEKQKEPELEEDFGDFVERLHSQFPEVSFAKLSRIAVRVKNWLNKSVEEINGKDYGIDGLWHAIDILERTLGEVDGYQTDDGILEHKAAINAVKKLYNQGPTVWKPSEVQLQCLSDAIDTYHEQGHPADALASLLKDLKRIYNP